MANKRYTSLLAPVERWLNAVTERDLLKGAVIVTLTGIFGGGAAYISMGRVTLPVAGIGGTVQAVSAVVAFVATLIGWALSSLIYHAFARLLGGKGDRNRMLALAGYATLPSLFQQLLRFVDYWLFRGIPLTTTNVADLLLDHFNVFALIGLVLVGVAVMVNYGISGKKAALIALTPTAITLLLGFYSLQMASIAAAAGQGGGLFGVRRLA